MHKYISSLVKRQPPVDWILENDPLDKEAKENDAKMMNVLKQCIVAWPDFWNSLESFAGKLEMGDADQAVTSSQPAPIVKPEFRYESVPDNRIYEEELNDVLTEYLFGTNPNLDRIEPSHPGVKCYVDKRRSPTAGYHIEKFHAERLLFPLFWPSARPGMQVIHVVGGAGAGKSTFIRFFFQHFLQFYEVLINEADPESDMAQIHIKALREHILLYVNLRRGLTTNEIRPYLYNSLGDGLAYAAVRMGFSIDPREGDPYSESWVKRQLSRLAREVAGNERRWYISWVLDNSDLMQEVAQKDLVNLLFEWIAEEPPTIRPNAPVTEGDRRELWRVIIPIRPETLGGLNPDWNPLHNRKIFPLDPIDHDLLVENRANYLFNKVSDSTKSPFVDIWEIQPHSKKPAYPRAQFNMIVPKEKAPEMRDSLRVAHGGKSDVSEDNIPEDARTVFDQLVNDSARQRLYLVRKVLSSRVFHERRRQGLLSPFYFFESLIRGGNDIFLPDDPENVILNLYNLGDNPKNDPYSIFVGVHSIFLLTQGRQWKDVKNVLARIGYPANHLLQCETCLKGKEFAKEVAGIWRVELPIVRGHWDLLKQRAYTDNMAVACATAWGRPNEAVPTDPLNPSTLLIRFTSSLWFLEQIWAAELALAQYSLSPEFAKRCGDFSVFSENRKSLDLPSITNVVAQEYLRKIERLTVWLRPKLVIERQRKSWDKTIRELRRLIAESGEPNVLDARRC